MARIPTSASCFLRGTLSSGTVAAKAGECDPDVKHAIRRVLADAKQDHVCAKSDSTHVADLAATMSYDAIHVMRSMSFVA